MLHRFVTPRPRPAPVSPLPTGEAHVVFMTQPRGIERILPHPRRTATDPGRAVGSRPLIGPRIRPQAAGGHHIRLPGRSTHPALFWEGRLKFLRGGWICSCNYAKRTHETDLFTTWNGANNSTKANRVACTAPTGRVSQTAPSASACAMPQASRDSITVRWPTTGDIARYGPAPGRSTSELHEESN